MWSLLSCWASWTTGRSPVKSGTDRGVVGPIGSVQDLAKVKLAGPDATSVGTQGAFVNADTATPARQ